MDRPPAWYAFLPRFAAGAVGSAAAGALVYQSDFLDPSKPSFQCLPVGAVAAGIFALVRAGRLSAAGAVAAGFAALQFGMAWAGGWIHAAATLLWGLFVGGGMVVVALIFDRLAERDYRFGKFLLAGPLLGGVYLAATPVAGMGGYSSPEVLRSLLLNTLLGIVIGDGVGLGVELADFLPGLRRRTEDQTEDSGESSPVVPPGDDTPLT